MNLVIALINTRLHGSGSRVNNDSYWPLLASFQAYFGENLVPSSPPDALRLCARGKGRGLSI